MRCFSTALPSPPTATATTSRATASEPPRSNNEIRTAAEQYATGMSLANVAAEYGLDAHTIANRFRPAGIPVPSRLGWRSHHTAR